MKLFLLIVVLSIAGCARTKEQRKKSAIISCDLGAVLALRTVKQRNMRVGVHFSDMSDLIVKSKKSCSTTLGWIYDKGDNDE